MTQTKQPKPKFKVGDLVQFRDKDSQLYYGIGIIIAIEPKQTSLGRACWVYWTKIGFDWQYEKFLERVT